MNKTTNKNIKKTTQEENGMENSATKTKEKVAVEKREKQPAGPPTAAKASP